MSTDDSRCSKCGGLKREQGAPSSSGRITQWVFACTCSFADTVESKKEAVSTVICRLCGKSIQQGRKGSFTQWVFRSDLCSCETPEPVVTETSIVRSEASGPVSLLDDDQPELEIPPDKFPLERYKPLSVIGSGASGIVYHCIDRMLNKRVAIKSIHVIDRSQLVGFQREAKTTSNLHHDNIVKILDFGATEGGSPYMVMDFINGVDLQTLIAEKGVLNQWQAVYLTYKVALGLAHAHSQEIFHRDIKCSNILVKDGPAEEPEPVLIDFGVAQFKLGHDQLDKTGIVGSPLYMAPDQAMGRQYDARSEIYSLGCSLFESLTGTVPFQGNTALETMSMHAHHEAPTLADAIGDLSLESKFSANLEQLVATCLAKDPESRYQSAQELARALKEILDSDELVPKKAGAEDSSTIETAPTKIGDNTKIIAATVGGLIIVGLSTVILSRTLQQQPAFVEKEFEVAGLDDFGRVTEKTLLGGAREGPFKENVNWDFMDPSDPTKKKSAAGGTFQQYKAPPTLSLGEGMMTVGEGDVTDADFAKLKGKKVEYFIVHSPYVNGSGLKFLSGTGVTSLNLGHCNINDNALKEVAKLTTVVSLNVESNPITDNGVSHLVNLPLGMLVLKRTLITDKSFESIKNIPMLGTLNVSGTAVTEDGIMSLRDMPSLVILDCAKMNFSNHLKGIEKFHNLKHLIASQTNVDDRTVAQIVRVSTLTVLILDRTKVTDFMFGLLPRLKQLERLSILECEGISQEAVERFKRKNPQITVTCD